MTILLLGLALAMNIVTLCVLFGTSRKLHRLEESTDDLEKAVFNVEGVVAGLITGGPRP